LAHNLFTTGGLEHVSIPLKLGDSAHALQQYSDSDEYFAAYCASLFIAEEYDSAAGSADYLQAGAITTSASSRTIGSFTDTFYNEPVGTHPGTSLSVGSTTTTLNRYLGYSHQYGLSDWKLSRAEADYPGEFDSDNFFYNNDGNNNHPIGRRVFRNDGTTFDQLAGLVGVDSSGDVWQMEGFEDTTSYRDSSPKGTFHDDDPLYRLADRLIVKMATEEYPGTFRLDSVNSTLSADWVPYISNVFSDTTSDSSNSYNIFIRKSFDFPASAYGASRFASAMCIRVDSDENKNIEEQWQDHNNEHIIGLKELDSAQMQTVFGLLCLHRRWQLDNFGDAVFSRDAPYGLDGENTIGSYVLIDSAGPPNIYGTWAARGTAVDEIHQTQDQQHDHSYSGLFSTQYEGQYSRQYEGQFSTQYEGDYEGQFTGQYTKQYTKQYTGLYTALEPGIVNYETYINYSKSYQGTTPAQFSGITPTQYEGQFTQGYTGKYTEQYTEQYDRQYSKQYEAQFSGAYTGQFSQQYTGQFTQQYTGQYDRQYTGQYTKQYTGQYDKQYAGFELYNGPNYEAGEPTEEIPYSGIGTFSQQYTGQFNQQYTGQFTQQYAGQFTQQYTGQYDNQFDGAYTGQFSRQYTEQYTEQYSKQFSRQYEGTFGTQYSGLYAGVAPAQYTGYSLTFSIVNYSNTIVYDRLTPVPVAYEGSFDRQYSKQYEGQFTGQYTKQYTKQYTGQFTQQYTGQYDRQYAGQYTGQYTGETIISTKTTVKTYSLWQRVA